MGPSHSSVPYLPAHFSKFYWTTSEVPCAQANPSVFSQQVKETESQQVVP